ncbi:MAG: DUF1501 domain-containing protein [Pirellulaceae bacterium]|nr:DUF1501 domain-containing protein [Pirellulaceae bacterium]
MPKISRRRCIETAGLGSLLLSSQGRLSAWAEQVLTNRQRRRHCILLWMTGGASQIDTFDMKVNHENGGEFKEIQTNVPGIRISEHLPHLSKQADKLAIVRSLSTKEGDHGRGTYLMRTGQSPTEPIGFPTIGSSLAKELGNHEDAIPNYVSISPYRAFNQNAFGPGFLGPGYAPLTVGATDNLPTDGQGLQDDKAPLMVDDLQSAVGAKQFHDRYKLWRQLQDRFLANHQRTAPRAQDTVYRRAMKLMNSHAVNAFDLSQESAEVRAAYGPGRFGQGCLMARRLIEQDVAFVEVSLGSVGPMSLAWDTHQNNFPAVKQLCTQLDMAWSALINDLEQRNLLPSTTIIWMSEFGRTPEINRDAGRDHFPQAWTAVLAGGGIQGGQAFGKTSASGMEIVDRKVLVGDLLATLSAALGVDPATENISELGRPIKIADGDPILDLLAS